MAHAKSVIALKELWPEAKVGASFAYSPSYAIDNKPENAMAKADYDDLKNYYWMDVYAYGRYPRAALAYLEANGVAPVFEEGDNAIMKEAAQLVDFMGVNYYQTTTVEFNDIDGVGTSHEMNTTGKKGTAKVQGVPGLYKILKMLIFQQLIGIGQLIQWELECVVVKLHHAMIYQLLLVKMV